MRISIPPLYTKAYLNAHPELEADFRIPEGIRITHKFKLKYIALSPSSLVEPDDNHRSLITAPVTTARPYVIDHLPIGACLVTSPNYRVAGVTLKIGLPRALVNEQGITLLDALWLMCTWCVAKLVVYLLVAVY
jgi:hypothetical protein